MDKVLVGRVWVRQANGYSLCSRRVGFVMVVSLCRYSCAVEHDISLTYLSLKEGWSIKTN